jgi:S1-C subfamily serine protease
MPERATRRRFLTASAVGALTALAGCTELQESLIETTQPTDETQQAVSSGTQADNQEVQEVGKAIRSAVVSVNTKTGSTAGGSGTGWFVTENLVVTNSHVIDGAASITCWTLDGDSFEPEIVNATDYRSSPYHDVAILRTEFSAPKTLSLGDESSLNDGQTVVQVGHPFAIGNWVIASGEYVREQAFGDAILSTVPHMSGNSGSPLVTLDETVVGLTTGGVPKQQRSRRPDEAPEPVEPNVYESYQDATYATHNPASLVEEYLNDWTSE